MEETLKKIMLEYVDVSEESIKPGTLFQADLEMTSVDIMTMISEIEDKFEIDIPLEDISNIYTFQDMCEYIEKKSERGKNE